jgi:ribonuclease P protein component
VLPKDCRLTRSADFARVYAQGKSWANRTLVLYRAPNALPHSRFGFSVSRRIGKAVVRNRTKRRIREVVRLMGDLIAPGWDIVIIARQSIVDAEHAAIEQSLQHVLRLAGVLRE